jgi:NAD(P)H-hydrate repair Nnr-like enzyme with NAD(P)H-hydrate dehydratase domain
MTSFLQVKQVKKGYNVHVDNSNLYIERRTALLHKGQIGRILYLGTGNYIGSYPMFTTKN